MNEGNNKRSNRNKKDDFDLDSFDLNEPTQVKKPQTKFKQVNNDDDDFGLDDLDFGGPSK